MRLHPGKIPLILEKHPKEKNFPEFEIKSTFASVLSMAVGLLLPPQIQHHELICLVRHNLKLPPERALFILFDENKKASNSNLRSSSNPLSPAAQLATVYHKYKDSDGFLYGAVVSEDVSG